MKMVQVQIVQHLQPGGIESLSLEFCQQQDYKVYLISLEGSKKQAIKQWPRLAAFQDQLIFLNKQPGWSLAFLWRLVGVLKRLKPTQVHTHHIGPLVYGGLAARLAGVRHLVHTEHDAWHLQLPRHRFITALCLRLCRPKLVADAQAVATQLTTQFPHYHCNVIENGIDTVRFDIGSQRHARSQLGLPTHNMLIGCAARLHPVKGHQTLLAALKFLPEQVHLALAGTGELQAELQSQAKQLGVQHRVHFLGHLDQMPLFYQALDVFCLASNHEGMPLSALEAQACGRHVVLTDVGGCAQCVGPASGLLVPPAQPVQLAQALNTMLSKSASTAPRTYIVAERSVGAMLRRYQQLLTAK